MSRGPGRRAAADLLARPGPEARRPGDDPSDSWSDWFAGLRRADVDAARAATLGLARLALVACERGRAAELAALQARAWACLTEPAGLPVLREELPGEDELDAALGAAGRRRAATATAAAVVALFASGQRRLDVDLAATAAASLEFALAHGRRGRGPAMAGELRRALERSLRPWLRGERRAPAQPTLPARYGRPPRLPRRPSPAPGPRPAPEAARGLVRRIREGTLSQERLERLARIGHASALAALRTVAPGRARGLDVYAPDALIMWRWLGPELAAVAAAALARAVLDASPGPVALAERAVETLEAWCAAPSEATARAALEAVPPSVRRRVGVPFDMAAGPRDGPRDREVVRVALAANLIAARMLHAHLAQAGWARYRRQCPGTTPGMTLAAWCKHVERWACDEPLQQCWRRARRLLTPAAWRRAVMDARARALRLLLG